MNFKDISFANPEFFWLLLVLPALLLWYGYSRHKRTAFLKLPETFNLHNSGKNWLAKLRPLLFALRLLAITALITALARPQSIFSGTRIKKTEGIDIVMAIDVSASMLARDLKPDRLQALKSVAAAFIQDRPNDRIGLVVYSGESYTKTPITADKQIVLNALNDIRYSDIIEGGTAIGVGLATAVNRIKDSKAKSKVIILMTDGVNNAGFIDPKIASELAAGYGIKVYTIGIGSKGTALSPVGINPDGSFQYRMVPVEIDEELMRQIAQNTQAKYFRATNNKTLELIYQEINTLEKTELEEIKYSKTDELYRPLALLAFGLILFELLLRYTLFRNLV
ncbi:MAG: VWA domain-containing protein [Flavobacteriaceae bacterium]|nr:VWA domain-containing protein [Flavobacteriaceae bacterium]